MDNQSAYRLVNLGRLRIVIFLGSSSIDRRESVGRCCALCEIEVNNVCKFASRCALTAAIALERLDQMIEECRDAWQATKIFVRDDPCRQLRKFHVRQNAFQFGVPRSRRNLGDSNTEAGACERELCRMAIRPRDPTDGDGTCDLCGYGEIAAIAGPAR